VSLRLLAYISLPYYISYFTVTAVIKIHLLVGLQFYMAYLMSDNKYGARLLKSVKFSGDFNIYRWRIYLWNASYALRKTPHLKRIAHKNLYTYYI